MSPAAQLRSSHNYHPQCGCHSCGKVEEAAENVGARKDALIEGYKSSPEAVREADSWTDGTQDGDHYSEVESAMADLHFCDPSDLLGSDLLARLYRLAKVHGEARLAQFEQMAEREANA